MTKEELVAYFTEGIEPVQIGQKVGMEIETQFVDQTGHPVSFRQSQHILNALDFSASSSWRASKVKGTIVTELEDSFGNHLKYDLGWQNFELATAPRSRDTIIHSAGLLQEIYEAALSVGAYPYFRPVLETEHDTLAIPDERDQIWIDLDGHEALAPLARISAVQFTFAIENAEKAILYLNQLGNMIGYFLKQYPQEQIWRRYIQNSHARYDTMRYGGPLHFRDIEHYCEELLRHGYVDGPRLVPCHQVKNFNIPLFLRSIWWYFRLKRYGNELCIEVRPLGRYSDDVLAEQLYTAYASMTETYEPIYEEFRW